MARTARAASPKTPRWPYGYSILLHALDDPRVLQERFKAMSKINSERLGAKILGRSFQPAKITEIHEAGKKIYEN